MGKLNIAIIGAGNIARGVHMPAYAKMEDVNVIAICDINRERAEKISEEYNIPQVFEDYTQVLELAGLDAVDICTPNYLHSTIAIAALEKGLHVFTEKPDAISVEQVERMKAAAEKSGKVLMAMRNNRFLPTSQYLKKWIEDGKVGDVYAGRCGWQRRRGIPGKGGWFTTKEKSGGGPLIDLGVHMIDLSIWLMGNPRPVSVSGCTFCKFAQGEAISDSVHSQFGEANTNGVFDVEDLAMGFIRFDNGACLQIEFSWASNIAQEKRYIELRGTKAGAEWSTTDGKLKLFGEEYGRTFDLLPNINNSEMPQEHESNLLHFVDVVLRGAQPIFVPEQGVDMIKILQAMYTSAEIGREVQL